MGDDLDAGGTPEQPPRGERLDSWKEIAGYLKRDVATARRWEKRESLPVHRHQHEKSGSVYAYTSELDSWAEGRRQQAEQRPPHTILGGKARVALAILVISLIVAVSYQFGRPDDVTFGSRRVRIAVHRSGTVAGLIATGLHETLARAMPTVQVEAIDQPGMLSTIRGIDNGDVD